MSDKSGKVGGKKVGGVKKSTEAKSIEDTQSVNLQGIRKASGVKGVSGIGDQGAGRGKSMSIADREEIFNMISDEAMKLFKKSNISKEQQELIEQAVKMAIDSGLTENSGKQEESQDEKKK